MPYFLWGQNKSWKQDCLPYNAVEIPTNHALHIYIHIYIYTMYIYIYIWISAFCWWGNCLLLPIAPQNSTRNSHNLWEIQLIAPSVAKKTEACWNSRFVALIFVEKHEFLRFWGLMSLTLGFFVRFSRESQVVLCLNLPMFQRIIFLVRWKKFQRRKLTTF